ncbi:hypothetical protein IFM89_035993 [Coptis chinensis]|uniref:DUF3444 domain-containing protein n=1 Tax=Coptis chinensis TaxID=261450 RepID=A0A835IVG3_9MAGN|nr:hypothetical protein IFM89_035993 [Coptis chinensis]
MLVYVECCSINAYKYNCYVFLQVLSLLRSVFTVCGILLVPVRLGFMEMFGRRNPRRSSCLSRHNPNSQFRPSVGRTNCQAIATGSSNQSSFHNDVEEKDKEKPRRSPQKRRLSNEEFKDRFGRLSRFRIPLACVSIINQLNRELDHTSEVETVEWLLKQAEPAVRAVLGKTGGEDGHKEQNNKEKTDVIAFNNSHRFHSCSKYELYSVWALSDNIDGMPRLYARIHRIIPEELEIEVALLEPLPTGHEEKQWVVDKNLPMVCGIFKEVNSKTIVKITAFSHKVTSKAPRSSLCNIFPHRGEIWALFKDWELNWTLHDLNSHTQYEIVEVVSDIPGCTIVVGLVRVEGFEAVFQRQVQEKSQQFSQKELLRFSHRVLASKSKGEEMDGVPSGLWMLESSAVHPELL